MKMQISTVKRNFNCDDMGWVLLAELPFMDFLSDQDQKDEPVVRSMFQTLRELGMSLQEMENIALALARFAREALMPTTQGRSDFPEWIRIFCQKKMIGDANSAKTSRPYHTEQGNKQKQIFPDSGANTVGGWGYFMIERGEDLPPYSSAIPHNYIGLYLYKEGE